LRWLAAFGRVGGDPLEQCVECGLLLGVKGRKHALFNEGDPESVEQVIATMSADAGPVVRRLAAPTFAAHSQRVHGTATPPRSTEL
jgi:hypothetical protein